MRHIPHEVEVRVNSLLDVVDVYTEGVHQETFDRIRRLVDCTRLDPRVALQVKREVEQVAAQAQQRLSISREVLKLLRLYHVNLNPELLSKAEDLVSALTK